MSVFVEVEGPTFVVGSGRPAVDVVRDVADDIRRALRASAYRALRGLACEFRAGVATLRGRVPTWYTRQMAQVIVRRVPGVVRLVDCVEVVELDAVAVSRRCPR